MSNTPSVKTAKVVKPEEYLQVLPKDFFHENMECYDAVLTSGALDGERFTLVVPVRYYTEVDGVYLVHKYNDKLTVLISGYNIMGCEPTECLEKREYSRNTNWILNK